MSKHMFRCFIGRGKMSVTDLETRINDWVANNDEWENDNYDHQLKERNTQPDGSGETYYQLNVRFHKTDTKANILQKFTDKLKDKVDWYRVGYHDCIGHDSDQIHDCSWDDKYEWTAKDVSIPAGVPDITVA